MYLICYAAYGLRYDLFSKHDMRNELCRWKNIICMSRNRIELDNKCTMNKGIRIGKESEIHVRDSSIAFT